MKIFIETTVRAPLQQTWSTWITPIDIQNWNFASDDWCCPRAEIDLKAGGRFSYRMEAKDGSMGFDFEGTFTEIRENEYIAYDLDDGREAAIEFHKTDEGVRVIQSFDAEEENSAEMQRQGWQNILNNFKTRVEVNCT